MTPEAKQAAEKIYPRDGKHLIETYAKGYDAATAKLREEIYMWLGQWRDKLPPHAVTDLQDVLGPLEGTEV